MSNTNADEYEDYEFDPDAWKEIFDMAGYTGNSGDHPGGVEFAANDEPVEEEPTRFSYEQHAQVIHRIMTALFADPISEHFAAKNSCKAQY